MSDNPAGTGDSALGETVEAHRPAVTINPAIRSGEPCISGTRVPVELVADTVWHCGMDEAELGYDLRRPDILVACWFAAVYPVAVWGRAGLKAQPNPHRARWRQWAEAAHKGLWQSDYDAVPDPPNLVEDAASTS